ncbi:MAG TPA: JAB domain-containing protein [Polyangiales bacterium]|nr:JAB domain-containing protein [Polyangiales bacterium]
MTSKLPSTMRLRECEVLYRTRKLDVHVPRIASSEDVYRLLGAMDAPARATESVWVLLLDARQKVVGVHECARGGVASVPVMPCDVYRAAVVAGSNAIILAHNHPSGDCTPSPEDFAFTNRVQDGGKILGIHVLDHLVVATNGYFSFLDAGHMKALAEKVG